MTSKVARLPPRRALVAATMFILLGSGFGGVLFLVQAHPDDEASVTFTVPERRLADRGVYEISLQDMRGDVRFEWQQDRVLVAPNGTRQVVHVVHLEDTHDARSLGVGESWKGVAIDRQQLTALARLDASTIEEEGASLGNAGLFPGNATYTGVHRGVRFGPSASGHLPCGLISPLQGRTVHVGDQIDDPSACESQHDHVDNDGAYDDALNRYWLRIAGIWTQGDETFMEVEHWGHLTRATQDGATFDGLYGRSWYEEGNPYPIEVRTHFMAERFHEASGSAWDNHTYRLTHLARGTSTPSIPPADPMDPVDLEWAAPTPWMFDERGIEHPFPASEARRAALDAADSGLKAFLSAHTDAFIADAEFYGWSTSTTSIQREYGDWRLLFSDGSAVHQVYVRKWLPVPALAGRGPAPAFHEVTHEHDTSRTAQEYASPDEVPAQLPTVAAMWQLWQRHGAAEYPDAAPNHWGWSFRSGHDHLDLGVTAGHATDASTYYGAVPADYQMHDGERSRLRWDLAKSRLPLAYDEQSSEMHWNSTNDPIPTHDPSPPARPSGSRIDSPALTARLVAPTLDLSNGERVAAAGLAALAVSVAYYFFPVLKNTLLAALFSRVRAHDALDHPVRRRLHDAIEASPGIHRSELTRTTACSPGQITHHLGKLVETGLVVEGRKDGYTCYFLCGTVDRHTMAVAGVTRSPTARALLAALAALPGGSMRTLGERADVSQPTVAYHLKRLAAAGLVERTDRGPVLTALGRQMAGTSTHA